MFFDGTFTCLETFKYSHALILKCLADVPMYVTFTGERERERSHVNVTYIGTSARHLSIRAGEHLNVLRSSKSAIKEHIKNAVRAKLSQITRSFIVFYRNYFQVILCFLCFRSTKVLML